MLTLLVLDHTLETTAVKNEGKGESPALCKESKESIRRGFGV